MTLFAGRPLALAANIAAAWRSDRLGRACHHAPLGSLDEKLVGKRWGYFQEAVSRE